MKRDFRAFIFILLSLCAAYSIALFVHIDSSLQPSTSLNGDEVNENTIIASQGPYDETIEISQGDTIAAVLNRLGINSARAYIATQELAKVFNPRDLKIGQEIYVLYDQMEDGNGYDLQFMRIRADIDHEIELILTAGGIFEASKNKKTLQQKYYTIEGDINISLYADALKAGASPKMLYDMIKAFSYDVDFQRDIHPGDQFSLVYDSFKDEETGLERPGELLYANLVLDGKNHEIYRFQPQGGIPGYYSPDGDTIRKALLRTPVDGARLSSGFGKRKHPVLGYTKMHKGIDFAAPTGTPIVAAGDGVIERASRYGSYGNYICIRHNKSTKTAYAHLSRYAKGIKKGIKVVQGQTIGYVGSTGRTTGAHLHFELLQAGKHTDPRKGTQLATAKLKGKSLNSFQAIIKKVNKIYLQCKNEKTATTTHLAKLAN